MGGCTICAESLSGKAVSCMTCDDIYHLRCIESWRKERFIHPLHSDHKLKLKLIRGSKSKKCTSCKLKITKYCLRCSLCKLSFHLKCSNGVDVLEDIGRHRHTFYKYWINDSQLARTCNVCSTQCGMSFYGCIYCNFSAHVECLRFPGMVKNRVHQHTVELTFNPSHDLMLYCALCDMILSKKVYYCNQCDDMFHTKCIMSTDEGEAASEEEQVRDIYMMSIERHLLNKVGKKKKHSKVSNDEWLERDVMLEDTDDYAQDSSGEEDNNSS
ncbi:unnamed protein product [Microthlaspi erraticum]|uniref:Phorbol-ester/DAG-type domain-containing protein n=1 Tax=Microthlaspi erraticum TaxID=1685480 RepID=A0A6D2JDK1_9BRAS|nr:unnamed protein product [Microthlaspi erraticum]